MSRLVALFMLFAVIGLSSEASARRKSRPERMDTVPERRVLEDRADGGNGRTGAGALLFVVSYGAGVGIGFAAANQNPERSPAAGFLPLVGPFAYLDYAHVFSILDVAGQIAGFSLLMSGLGSSNKVARVHVTPVANGIAAFGVF